MSKFWSPIVERLVPYTPGEQPTHQTFIKLNTNENPYGPSPLAIDAIRVATDDGLRLYPDPTAADLKHAIASTLKFDINHIFVGNGSDEVLAHSFNAFFHRTEPVLFADVTYSFYKTYCELYALRYREVCLNEEFEYDTRDYCVPCGGIVIANPNAPTGIGMRLESIEKILTQNPDIVVIVDEAYVDFGGKSAVELVRRFENLVVLQTFSKSRSLAGLRVGFAIAQPHLIEALQWVKDSFNSYPVGRLALEGARAAWADHEWFEKTRQLVIADRDRMSEGLKTIGFRVLPSATNFIFAAHESVPGEKLFAALRSEGILVRHFSDDRTKNWLRISVGTSQDCALLLESTRKIVAGAVERTG
ncbi:MAG: histidinol-phosphate transaminase [Alphaproteobacteria bacterium]|nr:histidinol-phosphate transaminase [Alphaproteobacteria bacterium]